MLFLSQTHNEFLNFSGSETFTKTSPLASKSAGKTLGLQTKGQSNGKIIYFKTEGQVASAQAQVKRKWDQCNVAGGQQQEKLPIAVPLELWLGMPLGDGIFKNPTELQIGKKFIFKGPRRYWIRTIWKKEHLWNLIQRNNFKFLYLQQIHFCASVNIHQPIMSIDKHSLRKQQPSSSGRKCSLLHLTTVFSNHSPEPFLTLQSWLRKYIFVAVLWAWDTYLLIQAPSRLWPIVSLFPYLYSATFLIEAHFWYEWQNKWKKKGYFFWSSICCMSVKSMQHH